MVTAMKTRFSERPKTGPLTYSDLCQVCIFISFIRWPEPGAVGAVITPGKKQVPRSFGACPR